jgi:hypothetical protein
MVGHARPKAHRAGKAPGLRKNLSQRSDYQVSTPVCNSLKTQCCSDGHPPHLTENISHFISNQYGLVAATGLHGGKNAAASSESAR